MLSIPQRMLYTATALVVLVASSEVIATDTTFNCNDADQASLVGKVAEVPGGTEDATSNNHEAKIDHKSIQRDETSATRDCDVLSSIPQTDDDGDSSDSTFELAQEEISPNNTVITNNPGTLKSAPDVTPTQEPDEIDSSIEAPDTKQTGSHGHQDTIDKDTNSVASDSSNTPTKKVVILLPGTTGSTHSTPSSIPDSDLLLNDNFKGTPKYDCDPDNVVTVKGVGVFCVDRDDIRKPICGKGRVPADGLCPGPSSKPLECLDKTTTDCWLEDPSRCELTDDAYECITGSPDESSGASGKRVSSSCGVYVAVAALLANAYLIE